MKAVEVLWNSRKQLMFTYIFAYFVAPHNQKTIFESNQKDLEAATEALSECFEQELTSNNAEEIMHNFMNKSRYVLTDCSKFRSKFNSNGCNFLSATVNAAKKSFKITFLKVPRRTGGLFLTNLDRNRYRLQSNSLKIKVESQ